MDIAIRELKGRIKHYEKERDMWLEAYKSDIFIQNSTEGATEIATKNANQIYADYVGKIERAISVLEGNEVEVEKLQLQVRELILAIYEHANEGTELMEIAERIDGEGF